MKLNKTKQSVELNKSQNEIERLACENCLTETRHTVLVSVDVSGQALDWDYYFNEKFQIVQCLGCETISFCKRHSNSEEVFWDEEESKEIVLDRVEVYPSRVAGRRKLWRVQFLPPDVLRIYEETHTALCNKQPVLAGIGIRALVETVCKEKAAAGGNLEKKIDSLVDMKVLTEAGARTLHNLRILGNLAAHEVKPQSEEKLGIAMDVIEHLLNDVYILPKMAEKLPNGKTTP